jgi:hypothetical protein
MQKTFQDAWTATTSLRPSSPAPASAPPSADDGLITKASRLLRHIRDPQLLRLARDHGYTQSEHEAGWALYRRASGERDLLRATRTKAPPRAAEHTATFRELAAFEDLWFARTRAILRRVMPLSRRDAFEATFFEGLSHDGDVAGLAASVRGYLDRFAALQTSSAPSAHRLWTMLRARGLNDGFVASTLARVEALEALVPAAHVPSLAPGVDQAIALAALEAWYGAWSVALLGAFDTQQLDQLGLRAA